MRTVKVIFSLALGAMLALTACEKEIPLPYNDGLVDQTQVIDDQNKQVDVPDRLGINQVKITNFPKYNTNGEYWDNGKSFDLERYPDLYVVINNTQWKKGRDVINTIGEYKRNARPEHDYGWKFEKSAEVVDPYILHRIALYDYDDMSKTSELMFETYFKPFDGANGYPESIKLNGIVATLEIGLDYKWYVDSEK